MVSPRERRRRSRRSRSRPGTSTVRRRRGSSARSSTPRSASPPSPCDRPCGSITRPRPSSRRTTAVSSAHTCSPSSSSCTSSRTERPHAVRPVSRRRAGEVAGHLPAAHVRPRLRLRRLDGRIVRRVQPQVGGGDLRFVRDVDASGEHRGRRAPDDDEPVRRGRAASGGYGVARAGHARARADVRPDRRVPGGGRPRPADVAAHRARDGVAALRRPVARLPGDVAHEIPRRGFRVAHHLGRLGDGRRAGDRHGGGPVADVAHEGKERDMTTLLRAALVAALLHITPTVVLVDRPDAVAQLLPGADKFFAREVHLSDADAHRLHEAVDWGPPGGVLTFYSGRRSGALVGQLEFVRVDTPHGPLEVTVAFDTTGAVRGVIVTKATVETKPWVLEAVRAGLVTHYRGLTVADRPAASASLRGSVGELPRYMAQQVAKGVARALVAYGSVSK